MIPPAEPDRLAALMARFHLTAGVYHTGTLCGVASLGAENGLGHLHLLRDGTVRVDGPGLPVTMLEGPMALLFPRAHPHRLDAGDGADLVCASLAMGGAANPLQRVLPPMLCLSLTAGEMLEGVLGLLFTEAAGTACGRQAALDRLAELAFLYLLRRTMAAGGNGVGLLAGLAHPALARTLTALHERPGGDWNLEAMAETAGMSRSSFADSFRQVVGTTPADYLRGWRLHLAAAAIADGKPLKQVARDVGYASHTALSRALSQYRREEVTSSPSS